MVIKFGGVVNIDKVPNLTDPDHKDVKLILTMYSLESFLFRRLNESCRLQQTQVIETLGPFSVALTKIIDNIQQKRTDGIKGEFTCYSGLAVEKTLVEYWKQKKSIYIEGYRSSSLDLETAKKFAADASTEDKVKIIFKIKLENKEGKYFIHLDRAEYTIYLDEKEILL